MGGVQIALGYEAGKSTAPSQYKAVVGKEGAPIRMPHAEDLRILHRDPAPRCKRCPCAIGS